MKSLKKIVSGGQTGVDRAALDVAIDLGLSHGGWCPLGRIAEDGRVPQQYDLQEHSSDQYSDRTRQNVLDSDATLILYVKRLQGGTALTVRLARELGKPVCLIRLDRQPNYSEVQSWMEEYAVETLNVAGPRASSMPEIYKKAYGFLQKLLTSPAHLFGACYWIF